MKNAITITVLFFLGVLNVLLVVSCKSKVQEIPPFGDVQVQVKDEKNTDVTGAIAYLYDNETAFNQAIENAKNGIYSSLGSVNALTSVSGVVEFKQLSSKKEYWILVHDTTSFFTDNGVSLPFHIDKDNTEAYYYVPAFQNGSILTAIVTLQPMNSLVKFQGSSLPTGFTKLKIGNAEVPYQPYIEVRKGNEAFYARTDACTWTGELSTEPGEVSIQNLASCNSTIYTFTATNPGTTEILITIGQGGNSGPETAIRLSSLKPTGSIVLPTSTNYTYFARSTDGKCVWQGKIVAPNTVLDICK